MYIIYCIYIPKTLEVSKSIGIFFVQHNAKLTLIFIHRLVRCIVGIWCSNEPYLGKSDMYRHLDSSLYLCLPLFLRSYIMVLSHEHHISNADGSHQCFRSMLNMYCVQWTGLGTTAASYARSGRPEHGNFIGAFLLHYVVGARSRSLAGDAVFRFAPLYINYRILVHFRAIPFSPSDLHPFDVASCRCNNYIDNGYHCQYIHGAQRDVTTLHTHGRTS